jgi:uncharacterized protein YbaA (DUF1428 family)
LKQEEEKMSYFDGFVAAVPLANKQAYLDHVESVMPIFREAGVTRMVETWSDDVPKGKLTDFYMAVQAKDDEAVVFSFVEWPDKAARDAGWAAMMADPRMKDMKMPFDGKRLIYGGFATLFDSAAGS